MSVDLKFTSALNTSHPVNLTFGLGGDALTPPDIHVTLSATVTRPTSTARIIKAQVVSLSAIVAGPTSAAAMQYDNAVYRGPAAATACDWQDATPVADAISVLAQDSLRLRMNAQDKCADAFKLDAIILAPLFNALRLRLSEKSAWNDGCKVLTGAASAFSKMITVKQDRNSVYSEATPFSASTASAYQDRYRYPRPTLDSTWGEGLRKNRNQHSLYSKALQFPIEKNSGWQEARKSPSGTYTWNVPVVPAHVCYTIPNALSVPLLFKDPFVQSNDIVFYCSGYATNVPAAAQIIPVQRTYIVINSVNLKRVIDNVDLPDVTLSMSLDMDSWTWGFSASMPASALALVQPGVSGDPILLEASINGVPYRLMAESIKRDRSFGKSTITVSGRGQSAELSDPYSPVKIFSNTQARTANQLMEDALTENGVSIGWLVDWQIDDWLVPAGAWTHQGSYMSAINAIAAAAGAFIRPNPVSKTLHVLSRNPVAPWALNAAAPDIQLPSDPVIQEAISWENRAEYDSVYVSGTVAGGVLGHIVRTGAAGNKPAPMVTDALITDVVAARQRGIYELSKFGKAIKYQLSLPIMPQTGIILPGKIVRYVDNGISTTGVVNSVSVNVSLPKASQTIDITSYV